MTGTATPAGRLAGKVALITGGAGNIGEVITRRYLAEGATVVITGRDREKLLAYRQRLVEAEQIAAGRVIALQMDGSQIALVRAGVDEILRGGPSVPEPLGRIDILVNNAGSAGPRRRLADLPLAAGELLPPDSETLVQAIGNLLGIGWNMVRAVAPHMLPGGSIINVSTIFSRTDYYGRIAYVVPKAALNALGQQLARELGPRGVRVNTIYPGPIESERIRTVFQAMDQLKGLPPGSTAEGFFGIMRLGCAEGGGAPEKRFPTPLDVANTAVFLGSDEGRAFCGHAFEVTNGMDVPAESRTTFVSRPGLRNIDAAGRVVLVWADAQAEEALVFADMLGSCRATVVLGFRDRAALARAERLLGEPRHHAGEDTYGRPAPHAQPLLLHLDPLDGPGCAAELERLHCAGIGPHDALILPGAVATTGPLCEADDQSVAALLEHALTGAIVSARALARFWQAHPPESAPRVLFVSDADDGAGNRSAELLRAGIEQLLRVWRHEAMLDAANAQAADPKPQASSPKTQGIWANQIIRYTNSEPANRDFAAAWVAKLIGGERRIDEITLCLPARIEDGTGVHSRGFGWAESLFGLHLGKVALITGGSAGIGGQIGRLLALSGAEVMLAARSAAPLEATRAAIVRELREAGYPAAERRVRIAPGCDVGDPASIERLVAQTLAAFGRVDYLINNAGIAGAEEMVVDLPLEGWRHTLEANLISNYRLIRRLAPQMKARGGYVLNVSSYFGGEKYVAIPYPNRADYAVSKAGQRALVEALARFLGPEIQINAIAPGPVEGDRLRGTGERPGLFERRARLILENKRLNNILEALLDAHRADGAPVSDLLPLVMANDTRRLAEDPAAPAALRSLAAAIWQRCDPAGAARMHLMNERIARRLLRRLAAGGYVVAEQGRAVNGPPASTPSDSDLLLADGRWNPPPEPFFTCEQIGAEAGRVREGIVGMLDLHRMPTEFDVALTTVYYLADRNVTGETFHPSGGLKFDRTVTEGELFGKASPARLERLRGETVFLVGEHLCHHLTRLAACFLDEHGAARVVLLTETEAAARELCAALPAHAGAGRLCAFAAGGALEEVLDRACAEHGHPAVVVSTPFRPLPLRRLAGNGHWDEVLSEQEFADLVEHNITHHFRVARRVSLIDGARVVLVTPETSARSTSEEFALANFVKTTLHALTATLGVESERTPPYVPVNQVDLTRRARSEEPRSGAEEEEELNRFVQAVLLVSAPLPGPRESRYRSRIYRGNAITV
ncbi:MAG TPA: SDR family NAD(P)-dependent oxidoreductase [Roseiflexaceae bacterium]|nr:SDR family NAD(P)-dependent oxidoreductase [Roseiflexaceae bacterium]